MVSVTKSNPLDDYEDHELLELMAMKDDEVTAKQAFNAFYTRYSQFLYNTIQMVVRGYSKPEDWSKVVFNNTFLSVYRSAHTFTVDDSLKAADIKKRIKGWLVVIAKNELKRQIKEVPDKEKEEEIYAAMLRNVDSGSKRETYDEKMVRQALEQLPKERDRDIFYLYWLYYEPGTKGQAKSIPKEVVAELCEKFNTSDMNLRQIISRSKKIVFEYLKKNYKKVKL